MSDDILEYYKHELAYLRQQGTTFSARYPNVAARLALSGTESQDPQTERLIEAVAFLTARVHRDIDQAAPELAGALLAQVCPSLAQPLPSMSIVRLSLDPAQGKVTAGYRLARHTALQAETVDGVPCHFRTGWDMTLWPVQVSGASLTGDDAITLTLETTHGATFHECDIRHLRVYLCGDWTEVTPLYALMLTAVRQVSVHSDAGPAQVLGAGVWREVGFAAEESLLGAPAPAYLPYVLLQEYFAFPKKFHFFDLHLPAGALGKGRTARLTFQYDRSVRALPAVRAAHFDLACVPVINLFERTSEPVRVDERHYDYPLVADHRHDAYTEIVAVEGAWYIDGASGNTVPLRHYAMASPASGRGGPSGMPDADPAPAPAPAVAPGTHQARDAALLWMTRMAQSIRPHRPGTDAFISFVDADHAGAPRPAWTVYARLLCSNRRLAEQMPADARMTLSRGSQHVRAQSLASPTIARLPPLGSEALWRLVSLLTLHYQTFSKGEAVRYLHDLLSVFSYGSVAEKAQIDGVRTVRAEAMTWHLGNEGWRGFCRGTRITMEFDEEAFAGTSPLLLAAVLARVFAMYTSVNSFICLVVNKGGEIWHQWTPIAGTYPMM